MIDDFDDVDPRQQRLNEIVGNHLVTRPSALALRSCKLVDWRLNYRRRGPDRQGKEELFTLVDARLRQSSARPPRHTAPRSQEPVSFALTFAEAAPRSARPASCGFRTAMTLPIPANPAA